MNLVETYKAQSLQKQDYLENLFQLIKIGEVQSEYTNSTTINKKEEVNDLFISFLEKILANDLAVHRKHKLGVIDLIDDLKFRNEILHLMDEKNNKNAKMASEHLGKKFMSSVVNDG